MEADQALTRLVDQLIDLFNRRSLDLPDGLFDRRTQFLLNGVSFEEMLGRQPSPADPKQAPARQAPADPLILMLARGPAGYRFIVKAVQHAVPDARVERGALEVSDGVGVAHTECWLSGHLRGTGDAAEVLIGVELRTSASGSVERAMVTMDQAAVERLREARLRP